MPAAPTERDALLTAMTAWRVDHPRATFAEIEVEAGRRVAGLRRELIAAALPTDPGPDLVCPTCGGRLVHNGTRTRMIQTDRGAPLPVTEDRLRCAVCGTELSPPE